MKRFAWLGVLLAWSVAGVAQAGLLSMLMDPSNNDSNDHIQDVSWSVAYSYEVQGSGGQPETVVEVYGLAAIDKVNDVDVESRTVWAVFSLKRNGEFDYDPKKHPSWLEAYDGWVQHTASSEKTFQSLLGVSDIDPKAMIAFVELDERPLRDTPLGPPGVKKIGLRSGTAYADLSSQFSELHSLISNGKARWLFAFGIGDETTDGVFLGPFNDDNVASEAILLNGLYVNQNAGVKAEWFNKLYDKNKTVVDESFYYFAHDTATVTGYPQQGGSYTHFTDVTRGYVNVVPEPASLIGLASLALAGGGLGLIRRRKA